MFDQPIPARNSETFKRLLSTQAGKGLLPYLLPLRQWNVCSWQPDICFHPKTKQNCLEDSCKKS